MKIALDFGHGGRDAGAVGNGFKEKDVVLNDIGLPLSRELKNRGYKIILTREKDNYVSLNRRVNIANNNNADIFVSLHLNSFNNPSANGYETYYYGTSNKGKKLANSIHKKVKSFYKSDRGIKTGSFYVLRKTAMPSVLLELGFISNINDLNTTVNNKAKIVQSIADGVDEYFGRKATNTQNTTNQEIYRVRESWSDASSQKGAYTNLSSAKKQADKTGLKVFDSQGKLIYPNIHWAEKHYDSLVKKGFKFSDKRFNDTVTRGELFAALDKITKELP